MSAFPRALPAPTPSNRMHTCSGRNMIHKSCVCDHQVYLGNERRFPCWSIWWEKTSRHVHTVVLRSIHLSRDLKVRVEFRRMPCHFSVKGIFLRYGFLHATRQLASCNCMKASLEKHHLKLPGMRGVEESDTSLLSSIIMLSWPSTFVSA